MKIIFESSAERDEYADWFTDLPVATLITNHPAIVSSTTGYSSAFVEVEYMTSKASTVSEVAEEFAKSSGWKWYREALRKGLIARYAKPSLFTNHVSFCAIDQETKKRRFKAIGIMFAEVEPGIIRIPIDPILAEQLVLLLCHYRETRIKEFVDACLTVMKQGTGYVEMNSAQAKFIYSILIGLSEAQYPVRDFILRLKGGIDLESEIA